MNIMNVMALEWTRIRQRRTKIVKQMKQLKSKFSQFSAREACVKNFMDNYEELMPSFLLMQMIVHNHLCICLVIKREMKEEAKGE